MQNRKTFFFKIIIFFLTFSGEENYALDISLDKFYYQNSFTLHSNILSWMIN